MYGLVGLVELLLLRLQKGITLTIRLNDLKSVNMFVIILSSTISNYRPSDDC